MTHFVDPIVLTGTHVMLEPLQMEHNIALSNAVMDGELWKLWYTFVPAPDTMDSYIHTALALREQGSAMPFVVREVTANGQPGKIIGATRMSNIDAQNRRLEIGSTWYQCRVQRTAVNTECKLLLLKHAFEQLQCIAVEFRTHFMNQQSRVAIARLGAKQDGILRNHMLMPDGSYRDTVVFSIIASEWQAVKRHLLHKLHITTGEQ